MKFSSFSEIQTGAMEHHHIYIGTGVDAVGGSHEDVF